MQTQQLTRENIANHISSFLGAEDYRKPDDYETIRDLLNDINAESRDDLGSDYVIEFEYAHGIADDQHNGAPQALYYSKTISKFIIISSMFDETFSNAEHIAEAITAANDEALTIEAALSGAYRTRLISTTAIADTKSSGSTGCWKISSGRA